MPNITPNFGIGGSAALIKDYGDWSAQQMQETGKLITTSLQRMNTNRQIQGLGQALSQTNPESPDWPQQAVALGAQFPLAMQSEAGQFLLGTQAKAHTQWANTQQAIQQSNLALNRSVALKGIRSADSLAADARAKMRIGDDVDFSGIKLPDTLQPRNPASGINLVGPTQTGEPLGAEQPDETSQLMGIPPTLDAASEAGPSRAKLSPGRRALLAAKELKDETAGTIKIKSGDILRLAGQEAARDRETERQASIAKRTESSQEISKLRIKAQQTAQELTRKDRLTRMEFDKAKLAITDLQKFREDMMRARENSTKAGDTEAAMAQWDKAQELNGQIDALKEKLLGAQEDESTQETVRKLDKKGAAEILKEAGGDKEKARALARERGFTF